MNGTERIKKILLFGIPVSICNFRCHYCYLSQRDESFQGLHPKMKYSPEEFGKAMSVDRIGGYAFANFCADGETFLVENIDQYVKAFVEQGHYAEVVTNLSVTKVLNKFLEWDKQLLKHLEFKCSFHYLELKKKGLLNTFADNVNRIWDAGASATIEITPSDELIPFIDEVKAFSLEHFGALPHLTIARDDRTEGIDYLTKLDLDEYDRVWSQFKSDLWAFKKTIFGVKQKGFCYAGSWSMYINLCTGEASACYCGGSLGNVFADPTSPLPEKPVGRCPLAHCYNGHALMTMGLIPHVTDMRYDRVRNRVCKNGRQWLQPELKDFFSSQLIESNKEYSELKKLTYKLQPSVEQRIKVRVLMHAILKSPNFVVRQIIGNDKYEKIKKRIKGNKAWREYR